MPNGEIYFTLFSEIIHTILKDFSKHVIFLRISAVEAGVVSIKLLMK